MKTSFFATLFLLALCSCSSSSTPEGQSTAKLDAVEVQPGTISDSMIILDDSSIDGTAVDNSTPDAKQNKEADDSKAKESDKESVDSTETEKTALSPTPVSTPKKVDSEGN